MGFDLIILTVFGRYQFPMFCFFNMIVLGLECSPAFLCDHNFFIRYYFSVEGKNKFIFQFCLNILILELVFNRRQGNIEKGVSRCTYLSLARNKCTMSLIRPLHPCLKALYDFGCNLHGLGIGEALIAWC